MLEGAGRKRLLSEYHPEYISQMIIKINVNNKVGKYRK
jgi:hypothetical protein